MYRRARVGGAWLNARKTHCPRGHPYDEANTYRNPAGKRECRACRRIRKAAHQARQRARRPGTAEAPA